MEARWLLMDVSHQGEVRLTSISPECPVIEHVTRFANDTLPTFTDALLRFERDTGQQLHGMTAIVAIPGVATGDFVPILRTRWNISRSGLASMLGRPVIIINEVATQAWATVGGMRVVDFVRGAGEPDLRAKGRHLFITMTDGVGTAMIDVDDTGRVTVLEAEGGHADFAPQNEAELALAKSLAPTTGSATWEQMLMIRHRATLPRSLAALSDAELSQMRASLLGRFVANMVLATCSWNGAIMTGSALPRFDASTRRAFDTGLTSRPSFPRLFNATRCWRVEQREAVLAGAAAFMMQRHRLMDGT